MPVATPPHRSLPVRVTRHGGAVMTFDDPRRAYKRVRVTLDRRDGPETAVCTLVIPPGSRVVYPHLESGSWNNVKLRAEAAHVYAIDAPTDVARSITDSDFDYRVGDMVYPHEFDPDTSTVCAPGIHCFPNSIAAENWSSSAAPVRETSPQTSPAPGTELGS